ncbi:MAG: transporter substrate-binding domain-containing protein [Burkholderiaceae bacterium]
MKLFKSFPVLLGLALSLSATACGSVSSSPDPVIRTLAPTGSLQIAVYQGSPTSLVRGSADGEARGVAVDLGRAMATSLGVASELVEFQNNADALLAVKEGRADFAFTNATPARARDMDFSPPVLAAEQGYLVPRDSPLASAASVDKQGVRVGVVRGSSSERELARLLKFATIVPVPSLKDASKLLADGGLDAFATNKAILFELSDGIPGSRVLPGNYGREAFAIGVPKGRESGLPWLRRFVEDAKTNGTVARAIERAGLRGVTTPD